MVAYRDAVATPGAAHLPRVFHYFLAELRVEHRQYIHILGENEHVHYFDSQRVWHEVYVVEGQLDDLVNLVGGGLLHLSLGIQRSSLLKVCYLSI